MQSASHSHTDLQPSIRAFPPTPTASRLRSAALLLRKTSPTLAGSYEARLCRHTARTPHQSQVFAWLVWSLQTSPAESNLARPQVLRQFFRGEFRAAHGPQHAPVQSE